MTVAEVNIACNSAQRNSDWKPELWTILIFFKQTGLFIALYPYELKKNT